jgi:bifunctional non-homologous end joining protein LigD
VRPVVAGISLSHHDRLIFPDLGITKLDLARYYDEIARWIVPHLEGRPLTLVHCPDGVAGPCRFLKHAKAWGPMALRRVRIQEKTKIGEYLVADSVAGVVALAQMGVVEIHTWNSIADDVECPNRLVWDLDPGPDVPWTETAKAALLLRDALETLGLASWVKTTGGLGLHVVVPIQPRVSWSQCLAFSKAVSEALVRADPRRYTIAFGKRGREDKILFDYLRNNRTNTSICAYSPRAQAMAPVSVPIRWTELKERPDRWTLLAVANRLRRLRTDPWAEYWQSSQPLTKRAVDAVRSIASSPASRLP